MTGLPTHLIVQGLALFAWVAPVHADMVVVNGRSVVNQDRLSLEVYKNDGCPISMQFLRDNSVDRFFTCEGDWDWDDVKALTRYYRDRVNIEREVDYFDVANSFPNACKAVDYRPGGSC
ncbi:hypothetical protein [Hoeflea olei]|uniref:Uncharacterized protein n=1 Tax=Hoeflea olei TaxID=1480615 RepID=A0A1C1YZ30_9HYPH|nr:hypothetical protein [Hoeflea olei]OCW58670.1 hypothetical protein AWJ14_00080 [Hoeflea olei]